MSTPVGTELNGRYRVEGRIGSGGMSTVYRAFDAVLERTVAVKLMHREIASDSDQLERFRREARSVARLIHPHIVTVIDAGEDDGTPYIVFEHVDGQTLQQRIRAAERLPVPEALAYTLEIARALAAAHAGGVIHRDVKPQNVLIDEEGRAKITDFGIARTLTEEGLTVDGRVLGTTEYVSPEQALGHEVGPQSDVYSLGVVLFEMLTGTVPFKAQSPVAVAMRHVREELPDVQRIRPEVSATVAAIVERATAKHLSDRYPDAETMAADLEDALALETARAGHAGRSATIAIETLPDDARRRLPLRLRFPSLPGVPRTAPLLAGLMAGLAAVVALLVIAANSTHRGVAPPASSPPPRTTESAISLSQTAAHDYNPYGTGPEHPDTVGNAVDGDPSTAWTTEHYVNGDLGKKGDGLYVDASPGVAAPAITIQTSTPGFRAQVWASNGFQRLPAGDPTSLAGRGWTLVGPATTVGASTTIPLASTRTPYRYYLVWILRLPQGNDYAALNEITLFRNAASSG